MQKNIYENRYQATRKPGMYQVLFTLSHCITGIGISKSKS